MVDYERSRRVWVVHGLGRRIVRYVEERAGVVTMFFQKTKGDEGEGLLDMVLLAFA